jgi:hypothetical protein
MHAEIQLQGLVSLVNKSRLCTPGIHPMMMAVIYRAEAIVSGGHPGAVPPPTYL